MAVGMIFVPGNNSVFFQWYSQKYFSKGAKVVKISFFAKYLIGKC